MIGRAAPCFRWARVLGHDGLLSSGFGLGVPVSGAEHRALLEGAEAVMEVGVPLWMGPHDSSSRCQRRAMAPERRSWEVIVELGVTLHRGEYTLNVATHHWEKSKRTIDRAKRAITFNVRDVSQRMQKYPYFANLRSPSVVRGSVRSRSDWPLPLHEAHDRERRPEHDPL